MAPRYLSHCCCCWSFCFFLFLKIQEHSRNEIFSFHRLRISKHAALQREDMKKKYKNNLQQTNKTLQHFQNGLCSCCYCCRVLVIAIVVVNFFCCLCPGTTATIATTTATSTTATTTSSDKGPEQRVSRRQLNIRCR